MYILQAPLHHLCKDDLADVLIYDDVFQIESFPWIITKSNVDEIWETIQGMPESQIIDEYVPDNTIINPLARVGIAPMNIAQPGGFFYNGVEPLDIAYNGENVDILAYNGEDIWFREPIPGIVGTPPPVIPSTQYPMLPISGGIVNPTQAQINAGPVGSVYRFPFNGNNNFGSGSVEVRTIPVGWRFLGETWGAAHDITSNTATPVRQGISYGSMARGEFESFPGGSTFVFITGQAGGRVWAGMGRNQPTATGQPSTGSFGHGGRVNLHTNTPSGNSSAQGGGFSAIFAIPDGLSWSTLADIIHYVILCGGGAAGANDGTQASGARGRVAVNQFPSADAPIVGGNPVGSLIGMPGLAINTGGRRTGPGTGFPSGIPGGNATHGTGGCAYAKTLYAPSWTGRMRSPIWITNAQTSQRDGVDTTIPDLDGMIRITRLAA